jgi:hypothetical protein
VRRIVDQVRRAMPAIQHIIHGGDKSGILSDIERVGFWTTHDPIQAKSIRLGQQQVLTGSQKTSIGRRRGGRPVEARTAPPASTAAPAPHSPGRVGLSGLAGVAGG